MRLTPLVVSLAFAAAVGCAPSWEALADSICSDSCPTGTAEERADCHGRCSSHLQATRDASVTTGCEPENDAWMRCLDVDLRGCSAEEQTMRDCIAAGLDTGS